MSLTSRPDAGPATVVARACDGLDPLTGRLWAAVAEVDLLDTIGEIARLRARVATIEAQVLVEVDTRKVATTRTGWASTSDWYAHTAGLTRGHARRTLRHAHDLTTDRAATHTALAAGQVSPAQADVICAGVEALPGDRDLRARAEAVLLEHAATLDATDLTRTARRVLDLVDPDHEDRRLEAQLAAEERAAHTGRFLWISDDGAGGVRIKGRGTLEDGAVLRAALLPLTRPEPATHPGVSPAGDPQPGEPLNLSDATELRDVRDHGARTWDALVRLAQHALDAGPAGGLLETCHGTKPRVSITMHLADLLTGTAAARRGQRTGETEDGLDLHPAVVRRLACDAEIIPVVLGTHSSPSEVLDVGRAHRTVTPAIWRALVVRDRHCAFPGCRRPPLMCHAHHVVHWADGGGTSLGNCVLLCGHHHRLIHHSPWRVRLNPTDHLPEFLPPPRHHPPPPPGGEPVHRATDQLSIRDPVPAHRGNR